MCVAEVLRSSSAGWMTLRQFGAVREGQKTKIAEICITQLSFRVRVSEEEC